ncbi:hypothetical protein YerA41_008 [Yersinia phage YerA41]|nr:hypothetical protein YerA41_008 [Yersinia phage YerA41]
MGNPKEFICDLTYHKAPSITGGDNDQVYRWRYNSYGDALDVWKKVGVVPEKMLHSRVADKDGNWLGPISHDCLPDYSCCEESLLAPDYERSNYVNGCFEVRSNMDRNFTLKMWITNAKKYEQDPYSILAIRRFSTPENGKLM